MSVWWLYVLVSQLVAFAYGNNHAAKYTSKDIASIQVATSLSKTHSSYNYLPYSHRITDQGLSYESVPVNTFFKKKDLKNYNPNQIYFISKHYINITYILPVNPMVVHHWICRIQV